jgi:hypothetical protein
LAIAFCECSEVVLFDEEFDVSGVREQAGCFSWSHWIFFFDEDSSVNEGDISPLSVFGEFELDAGVTEGFEESACIGLVDDSCGGVVTFSFPQVF